MGIPSFNSIVVRLKEKVLGAKKVVEICFNSIVVRLKVAVREPPEDALGVSIP